MVLEHPTNKSPLIVEEAKAAAKMASNVVRRAFYGAVESPSNGPIQLTNAGLELLTGGSIPQVDLTGVVGEMRNGSDNSLAVQAHFDTWRDNYTKSGYYL